MKTITIYSGKGGVGKTTTAYHIARSLAGLGHSVLALDADQPAKGLTGMMGITNWSPNLAHVIGGAGLPTHTIAQVAQPVAWENERIAVVPSNTEDVENAAAALMLRRLDVRMNAQHPPERVLLSALAKTTGYDYAIIDSRPTLDTLAMAAIAAADVVVIPAIPEQMPIGAIEESMEAVALFGSIVGKSIPCVVLATMVDDRLTSHRAGIAELSERFGCVHAIPKRSGTDAERKLAAIYRTFVEEVLL
jgi:chromosome partitioning protein